MSENSVAIFTRASLMLAEADTIQKAKELNSLALTAADWAKRKGMGDEAVRYALSYAFEAERKMGEMCLAEAKAGRLATQKRHPGSVPRGHTAPIATTADIGLTRKQRAQAQGLAELPRETFEDVRDGKKTRAQVQREQKTTELVTKLEDVKRKKANAIEGRYDVIVIDPPWPMEKIERDVRPNQSKMDYPTMTLEDISKLDIGDKCGAEDCHVWLWTTHRFLPFAFRILTEWELKYVCCFVWHKPGGFQPVGLPQYNSEFALYARKGSPAFVSTKALPTCFTAERGKHSEKPSAFYEMVQRVTAGRRLDMFARKQRDGFDVWGNEI